MQQTFIEHILYSRLDTRDMLIFKQRKWDFNYFKHHLYTVLSDWHRVNPLKISGEEIGKHCYKRDSSQFQQTVDCLDR